MADKGEYRGVYVALVDSWEFQELSACARACLFVLKLKLGKAGIDVFYPETLPRYTGHTSADCLSAMEELEQRSWIRTERNVVWLRNGMRFDPTDPMASPNGRSGVANHLNSLPCLPIVEEFADYYGLNREDPKAEPEAPSKPLAKPLRSTEDGRRKTDTETETTVLKLSARDPIEDAANEIIIAANRGMTDNPNIPDLFDPISIGHGSRQDVLDWIATGIPPDLAAETVYQRARDWKPSEDRRQISTMRYFTAAVAQAFRRHQAAQTKIPNGPDNRGVGSQTTGQAPTGRPASKYAHLVQRGDQQAAG